MSGEPTFRTKQIALAKKATKKKVYVTTNIGFTLDKSATADKLIINCGLDAYGNAIIYHREKDALTIKFDDDRVISLLLIDAHISLIGGSFTYRLTPEAIDKFKSGAKVTALRITVQDFNIDISEFKTDMTAKFNECWLN